MTQNTQEITQIPDIKKDELKKVRNQPLKKRCIFKSWYWIEKFFDNPKNKPKDKAYLASKIVCKDMDSPLIDQSTKNYVQIFRPTYYTKDEVAEESVDCARDNTAE